MNASPTLKRSLTLKHVILFGLSFMAPVTVFATYGVAIEKTNGMIPTALFPSLRFPLCFWILSQQRRLLISGRYLPLCL